MDEEDFILFNFLGIEPPKEESRIWITVVPVAYDSTVSYKTGTREGPAAIIAASRFIELYDAELRNDFSTIGIDTYPLMQPHVGGPEKMVEKIEKLLREIIMKGKRIALLGGEHTVTLGAVRALIPCYPNMGVLQIDAHSDLRDSYEGSPYSHGCVMRRTLEYCPITQVAIRSVSKDEHEFILDSGLSPFYAWDIAKDPQWMDKAIDSLPEDVYITVDLDGLDPSIMPSVGTPEPGGLLWHETTEFLKKIADSRRIIGFDVVELCPNPLNISPDFLASRLVYRLIALTYLSQTRNT